MMTSEINTDLGEKEIIKLTLPSSPEYVSVARLTLFGIASRMGFNMDQIDDLKVAVSEACTNALIHAENAALTYSVDYIIDVDRLTVEVTDQGKGFEVDKVKKPDIQKPTAGGLGLFIIQSLMDEVTIDSKPDAGTKLTMMKLKDESGSQE
jgi:serine/threonine-protein kinase RsbW